MLPAGLDVNSPAADDVRHRVQLFRQVGGDIPAQVKDRIGVLLAGTGDHILDVPAARGDDRGDPVDQSADV